MNDKRYMALSELFIIADPKHFKCSSEEAPRLIHSISFATKPGNNRINKVRLIDFRPKALLRRVLFICGNTKIVKKLNHSRLHIINKINTKYS